MFVGPASTRNIYKVNCSPAFFYTNSGKDTPLTFQMKKKILALPGAECKTTPRTAIDYPLAFCQYFQIILSGQYSRYLYSKIKAISPQYWLVQLFRPIQASSANLIASPPSYGEVREADDAAAAAGFLYPQRPLATSIAAKLLLFSNKGTSGSLPR